MRRLITQTIVRAAVRTAVYSAVCTAAGAGALIVALAVPGHQANAAQPRHTNAAQLRHTNAAQLRHTNAAQQAAPHWLAVNAKAHAVTFTVIAGYSGALGGLNFNGDVKGKMVLSVPAGYRINVVFTNKGPAPHSAVFTPYAQRDNTAAYRLAFPGSSTPHWLNGTPAGQTQRFSFVAKTAGTYALVCGVPGHEAAGMWDVLKVTHGGMAHLTV